VRAGGDGNVGADADRIWVCVNAEGDVDNNSNEAVMVNSDITNRYRQMVDGLRLCARKREHLEGLVSTKWRGWCGVSALLVAVINLVVGPRPQQWCRAF